MHISLIRRHLVMTANVLLVRHRQDPSGCGKKAVANWTDQFCTVMQQLFMGSSVVSSRFRSSLWRQKCLYASMWTSSRFHQEEKRSCIPELKKAAADVHMMHRLLIYTLGALSTIWCIYISGPAVLYRLKVTKSNEAWSRDV